MSRRVIRVEGAQEHNLQHVNVTLPRDRLVVLTGVSGSGKSSLAFDTIYQEGQRRYVESLSAYARQFIGQAEKPRVDHIEGLSPTVAITQKTTNRNPRSTVGTITEIYDYLRVLFARVGTPHCPHCGTVIEVQSPDEIIEQIFTRAFGQDVTVLGPIVRGRKGEYRAEIEALRASGYARVKIDGHIRRIDEPIVLERNRKHSIAVVVDRLHIDEENRSRLTEAVEVALQLGKGLGAIELSGEEQVFSAQMSCRNCGLALPELEPRSFSFNTPQGWCPACNGLGKQTQVALERVIIAPQRSILEGCFSGAAVSAVLTLMHIDLGQWLRILTTLGIAVDAPWQDLSTEQQHLVLHGAKSKKFEVHWSWVRSDGGARASGVRQQRYEGLSTLLLAAQNTAWQHQAAPFLTPQTCADCGGCRLRRESLAVLIRGKSISDVAALPIAQAAQWIERLEREELSGNQRTIARQLLREISLRLGFLMNVGLDYLTIDRTADTLSGGEAQRIRLATQVGSGLEGVTYVLDEPSIGLHHRDNERLLRTLRQLRDRGNSVLVVEHDDETMRGADWIVDVGPGSGSEGGRIVAEGTPGAVAAVPASLTGRYLAGTLRIPVPNQRRLGNGSSLSIVDAAEHNLQHITVHFPLGTFICVTGVSGSGKSTLIDGILKRALARLLHGAETLPGKHARIEGAEHLDKVIEIDQSPIGRTPRSNPATYTGAFDYVRDLFAKLPESRVRGYKPGRFSFNVKGGRCEACAGDGSQKIEMQFLADVEVPCEVCNGQRFNRDTLSVLYRGKNIAGVLAMRIDEAARFFENIPPLHRILQRLVDVGLGYMQLGQSSTTLSGGEAQRVKLASELGRPATGRTLYILDEPTTGLHVVDVQRLLDVLQRLVDAGNTVLVIEHHPDVIKVADWIVDLGPEGGQRGGCIVAEGTPEDVAKIENSYTGQMLRQLFTREWDTDHAAGSLSQIAEAFAPFDAEPDDREGRVIHIEGARKHNLQHITVDIPKDRMTVITGVSGSGKSTLALDTLFAEGQRRFVECLSAYARQFLGRMDAAEVDRLVGLAPAIAIDQRHASRSPRSIVATQTELYDYFRLLWARCGTLHCPTCGCELERATSSTIVDALLRSKGRILTVLAPLDTTQPLSELLAQLRREGFRRLRLDGDTATLDEVDHGASPQTLELIIDRTVTEEDNRGRLADAIELGLAKGSGTVLVDGGEGTVERFSEYTACPQCSFRLDTELTPRDFSFNSFTGACPTCHGLARVQAVSPELLIPDPRKSLRRGGIPILRDSWLEEGQWRQALLATVAGHYGFTLDTPLEGLTPQQRQVLLYGSAGEFLDVHLRRRGRSSQVSVDRSAEWEGFIPMLTRWFREDPGQYAWVERYMQESTCPDCRGERLKPVPRAVTLGGKRLPEVCALSVQQARTFFAAIRLPETQAAIAEQPLKEVRDRLGFLNDVGLGYLELDRSSATLSGGEAQRVRLATQIGSKLVGVLYVLDEPSVGLHPRDVDQLLDSLAALRDLGNTLVLVEHDAETMRRADHIIDLGPGAGRLGGQIVAAGSYGEVLRHPTSLTARYLRGELTSVLPQRRGDGARALLLHGARAHNLKNIDVRFPLSRLIAVTGVSGSGKSSLITGTLARVLEQRLRRSSVIPGAHQSLDGVEQVTGVVIIDQSPIGRSPRSNPATYSGVFESIRDFFANLPESRVRGFTPARFSFNERQGMCPACGGEGVIAIEMHFLADVTVPCEVCSGRRYNAQTLQVKYRGKSIAGVLELTIDEALEFFQNLPAASNILQVLSSVGLGYLRLGQPVNTLSRGESQRLKLAAELCRQNTGGTVYILDEPTTGLHAADVQTLLAALQRLVDRGNTVIVIEHHMDVVKVADYVIDLGPEGGERGGYLVTAGLPEAVAQCDTSRTAPFLGRALDSLAASIGALS